MDSSQQTMQLAMDLHQQGRLEEAGALYRKVLDQHPGHFGANHLTGLALLQRGQAREAEPWLSRAVQINPGVAEAHANHGNALAAIGLGEASLASYQQALALQPSNPRWHFSLGNSLQELARLDEAEAAFNRAIELDPGYDNAFVNRGVLRLLRGDFQRGLPDYERRRPRDPARRMLAGLATPDWNGEDLAGRSLLVSDATGLGDVIQFCRYLPMLADRGARVSFLGNKRLVGLLQSLDPRIELLAELAGNRQFDFHCKLLSLPLLCATDGDSIPSRPAYLHARPELVHRWRERIGGHGFRIGVCWRGNPSHSIDAGRAIPLAGLEEIAALPGVRLISLQKRFGLEELASLPSGMIVETLGEDFDEGPDAFLDSAAAIATLDLVICSCTSVAHLAGSLGAPTWVALKRVPEWRWQLDRPDNPWYPSHRLFRQPEPGDWASVFSAMTLAMRDELAAWPGRRNC